MKNIFLFTILLIVGFSISLYFVKKTGNPIIQKPGETPLPSQPQEISYDPNIAPPNSFKGTLTFVGGVDWEARTATESAKLSAPVQIQQGENLITEENGQATINFENVGNLKLHPQTEVDFIQLLPVNFVVAQKSGTVEYKRTGNTPVSIRSMHLLINQEVGDLVVSIDKIKPIITLQVKKGTITLAFNNIKSVSQLINVPERKTATYNDTKRTVKIR